MNRYVITHEEIKGQEYIISSLYDENRKMIEVLPDPAESDSILGNIYIGRVENIVKNLNAAFIKISPQQRCYFSLEDLKNPIFTKKLSTKKELAAGDELLVQVTREALKTKEPAVTTNVSLPGKYAVLTTGNKKIGVSSKLSKDLKKHYLKLLENWKLERKLLSETEDQNPKNQEMSVPKPSACANYGIIIRTNAADVPDETILDEIAELETRYFALLESAKHKTCYSILSKEPSPYLKHLNDLRQEELEAIVTDDRGIFEEVCEQYHIPKENLMTKGAVSVPVNEVTTPEDIRICHYRDESVSLSSLYSVKPSLEDATKTRVWLKSGAYLLIEHTEALTVIDVNTGKNTAKKDVQENFLKVNKEAAIEIARQLRLRNISGMILVDFMNLTDKAAEEELLTTFRKALRKDPVPTQLVDITKLGLVEVTRKKVKKSLREILTSVVLMLCTVFLSLMMPLSVSAETDTSRVIRVGYPLQRGMTECDEDGNYSGYTHEYLQTIEQHTGYEFEYVTVQGSVNEQLTKMLEMLKNGEIDLLGGLAYSPAMSEQFDYIMNSYGTYERGLYVLEENKDLNRETLYEVSSVRVAIFGTETSTSTEILQAYMDGIGVKLKPVFVDSVNAQIEALENGEADALLANNLSVPIDGMGCICHFDPQPFYFATTKGDTALLRQMNAAISDINNADPFYTKSLMQKYFYSSMHSIALTNDEKEYLNQLGTLHIIALGEKAPLIYEDSDGTPMGVAISLLEYMAEDSELTIDIKIVDDIEKFVDLVQAGHPDLVLCSDEMPWVAETGNYLLSRSYMSAPTSLVVNRNVNRARLEELREAKVCSATENGDNFTGTAEECLQAIDKGDADYAYINTYSVEYYKNNRDLKNIYAYPDVELGMLKFHIGVNKKLDHELFFLLNKCIYNIPRQELLSSYLYENTEKDLEMSMWEYARLYKLELCSIFVAIVAVFLLIFLYWKYTMEKRNKEKILELSRRDGLTSLYNATAFRMFVKERLKTGEQNQQMFLMIDVDKFKNVNDTFGHLYGDFILKTIADAQKESFGTDAILGRVGGDEFVLFSDDAQVISQIEERCRLLKERLAAVEAPDKDTVFSVSIGGVITAGITDYETLYKKADKIMYGVKGQGGSGYQIVTEMQG